MMVVRRCAESAAGVAPADREKRATKAKTSKREQGHKPTPAHHGSTMHGDTLVEIAEMDNDRSSVAEVL